jgi:hypothetical protein
MIRILILGMLLAAPGALAQEAEAGQATIQVNVTALAAGALDHAAHARVAAAARSREIALRHVDDALRMARQAEAAAR